MMGIGERIRQLIDSRKVTPYEISLKTGISQSTFSRILNDNTAKLSIKNIDLLANYFDVSVDWLRTGEGEMIKTGTSDVNLQTAEGPNRGVPYYDIDVTASLVESFSDIKEEPEFYVDFKPFNDCSAYLPVYGDSMYPMIASGEIVALKKIENPQYIQYGEPHLVITDAEANNMRTIKIVRKSIDKSKIILKPANPNFDELEIPRKSILSLYIVKGKITRKQL